MGVQRLKTLAALPKRLVTRVQDLAEDAGRPLPGLCPYRGGGRSAGDQAVRGRRGAWQRPRRGARACARAVALGARLRFLGRWDAPVVCSLVALTRDVRP